MISPTSFFKLLILIVITINLVSCTRKPVINKGPAPLQVAVKQLTDELLSQVDKKASGNQVLVMDDFTDEDTGEYVAVSETIEKMLLAEAQQRYRHFTINKIDQNNVRSASFLINGIIALEQFDFQNTDKIYHLYATVTDLKTGQIIANASSWISDKNLDYSPLREYKEAPMFMNDLRHKSKVKTARSALGSSADMDYFKSIEITSLLAEATNAFEKENYSQALQILNDVANRPDGQVMNTYSLLYQVYFQMGDLIGAEDAFGRLVDISIKNNSLSIRLLFDVNSTEFIADKAMRARYKIWIKQVSKYFKNKEQCVKITGHTSHTGTEAYNDRLSKARAVAVQRQMASNFKAIKRKSVTFGMGFRKNIKGLGTDDSKDALDRRVEFEVIECAGLS